MNKFVELFKKVDGVNVLKQYANSHVLFHAIIQTLLNGFSKKALEIVRLSVNHRILMKLRKKYKTFIKQYTNKTNGKYVEHKNGHQVWVCWLQGMENAPKIVQQCHESLQKHVVDKEIIVLTEENYKSYVSFPSYVQEKIDNGIISKTHFSDLLRLELLINYGGTWIDSTVFCSGSKYPKFMLDSDLFMFQNLKPGLDGHSTRISSWFMTACTNNPILLLTRALLYEYWKSNNRLIDYFLLHYFMELAIETYPNEWMKVIPVSNSTPHILLLSLFEKYDDNKWMALQEMNSFHKISYKLSNNDMKKKNTYYSKLFGE